MYKLNMYMRTVTRIDRAAHELLKEDPETSRLLVLVGRPNIVITKR